MEVKEASCGDGKRPPWVHLVSAFFAMEPSDSLISISRNCGGGAITENVQYFIWNQCISKTDGKGHTPYVTSFLKKVVLEVESAADVVIDELYKQLSFYMTSLKGDDLAKGAPRVIREISFLYPTDHVEARVCQNPRKVVVPLNCSLNMLEGDTGCSIWPSSLFLSEFILSCPELFSMKSCFEQLGSGVGLVGICLAHVKPSKVVLSDGDLSTLANLKVNLELNHMNIQSFSSESEDPCEVKCLHLPWESAVESDLQDLMPDIVLGADVIYDPQCIPHLVHVIVTLLTTKKSNSLLRDGSKVSVAPNDRINSDIPNGYDEFVLASTTQPVAYIASVVRNINTYNYFHKVAQEANLRVVDITQNVKIFNFLPYMLSYQRSSVRLLGIYQSFH
ncbi:putative lysine methyltransferase, S-adenosyl-L-methionine-dependent methyltransferase [Helianthus annuus]|nr:putative lysine methyltransferase, S-adenosyl-L-methionine-dependent methyltransferase [Helianthus annuus]